MALSVKPNQLFGDAAISMDELFVGASRSSCKEVVLRSENWDVSRGISVFSAGERPLRILIHLDGRLSLSWNKGFPRLIEARPSGPHYIFGLIETLSATRYGVTMQTVTDCTFGVMRSSALVDMIRRDPRLCYRLAEILSRLCSVATKTIHSH
jgi:hypothetical protein